MLERVVNFEMSGQIEYDLLNKYPSIGEPEIKTDIAMRYMSIQNSEALKPFSDKIKDAITTITSVTNMAIKWKGHECFLHYKVGNEYIYVSNLRVENYTLFKFINLLGFILMFYAKYDKASNTFNYVGKLTVKNSEVISKAIKIKVDKYFNNLQIVWEQNDKI